MADTLVIIPTYNEIDSLERIVGRLRQSVPEVDLLVVDDASPDGTGDLAERLAAADPHLTVLHRDAKDGLGRAYLAGFDVALSGGYQYVVEIDADGSHDPASLPAMLALARAGNWYARVALRSSIRDITAGFRVYRASALRDLDLSAVSSQGYCFQVELAWQLERTGHRIAEHPITFVERATGRSKMHSGIVLEALVRVTIWGVTYAPIFSWPRRDRR